MYFDSEEQRRAWREWFRWFESLEESLEETFLGDQQDPWGLLKKFDKIKEKSKKIVNANIKSMFEEISDEGAYSEPWEKIPWECSCESRIVEDLWAAWDEGTPLTTTFVINLNDLESKKRYFAEMGDFAKEGSSCMGMCCHKCRTFLGPEEEIRVINEVDV